MKRISYENRRVMFTGIRPLLVVGILLVSLFLLSCNPSDPQSTFDAKGPIAEMQLGLFWIIFWVAVAVFVVVEGALLYTVVKFRRKNRRTMPRQTHGNKRLEIAWTIAPTIILVFIAVPTVMALFASAAPARVDALNVKVVAHQWWWEFEYPELGLVTANEMHIPVGRDVNVELESADVIHSFWIPKLAGKLDIIPTRTNRLWFRADEPGNYSGQCAEFCGIAHALMKFRVIADVPEVFDRWVTDQLADAHTPESDLAKEGSRLFITKQCIVCHKIAGTAAQGIIGPNLTHISSRGTIAAGILENDQNGINLTKWLKDPEDIKPGNIMSRQAGVYSDPDLQMSDDDIDALVAYLLTLK